MQNDATELSIVCWLLSSKAQIFQPALDNDYQ